MTSVVRIPVPKAFLTACLLAVMSLLSASAQVTAGASPGLNAALVRLLGGINAFTAHLEIRSLDPKGVEVLNAPMQFSLLENKMRGELDVTRLKSKDLPAMAATAAKSVGMDRVITLVRPDKKESYLLYPMFQACVVAPLDEEDLDALKQPAKLASTALGKETLDGHPCVKNRVVVTEFDGRQHEATVWNATDLKNFPLQIQTQDEANTLILRFGQVKFEKPDAKLFELPVGTAKYSDAKELTTAVMKKMLSQAFGK